MTDLRATIELLKTKVELHTLISEKISLTQKAGRYLGLCPFHGEKTPSFYVFDNSYHCFGCGAHGDCIEYIKFTNGLSFIEAVKFLAEKYSVPMPESQDSQKSLQSFEQNKQQYKILSLAQEYYVKNLWSDNGENARSYLNQRGFSDEKIKEYGFGLTFDSFDGLVNYLKEWSLPLKMAHTIELVRPSQKIANEYYDFFRNRLMIPIRDKQDRVVAFGGRTLDNNTVKYVNSPNHALFNKKSLLFGLSHAQKYIRSQKRALIVEGYMDTLQLWNSGFNETVAVLGTALSSQHLEHLSHQTNLVYLVFDGDQAGVNASLRAVDTSLQFPNLKIKVVQLPDSHDPDSYLKEYGSDKFNLLLNNSEDLLSFIIKLNIRSLPKHGISNYIQKTIAPWLQKINDPLQKNILVQEISQITGVSSQIILTSTNINTSVRQNSLRPNPIEDKTTNINPRKPDPSQKLESELIAHLYFAKPQEIPEETIKKFLDEDLIVELNLVQIIHRLLTTLKSESPSSLSSEKRAEIIAIHDQGLIEWLNELNQQESAYNSKSRPDSIEKLYRELKRRHLKKKVDFFKNQLQSIQIKSPQEMDSLGIEILNEISMLNKQINQLI